MLVAHPFISEAKFPGILQRYQLGYSFVSNKANYEIKQKLTLNGNTLDSTFNYDMKTSGSFGATMGTYVPIKRLGRKSNLSWGIDYMYNMMLWDTKTKRFDNDGKLYDAPFSGATVQMALPTGLDLKFGCDAMTLKNHRFCATLGVGALPSFSMTTLDDLNDIAPQFSVAPYVKGEVGVYAGACFKLRAIYTIGNLTYVNQTQNSSNGKTTHLLQGASNLTVSILVMPFAFTWHRDEWFNTF